MEYEAGEEDDRGHLVEVDYEDNDEYDFMDDSERPRLKKSKLAEGKSRQMEDSEDYDVTPPMTKREVLDLTDEMMEKDKAFTKPVALTNNALTKAEEPKVPPPQPQIFHTGGRSPRPRGRTFLPRGNNSLLRRRRRSLIVGRGGVGSTSA